MNQSKRRGTLLVETETSWFILASALDFAMTYILLRSPHFTESNPIALFFIHHWGIKGLFLFKLSVVALVVGICQVIAHHNPNTARKVLYVGTAIVAAVVIYSMWLHEARMPPVPH